MTAVDTNVLVRLLTGDDEKQTLAARSLFASETIWIAKTVLLETDWVLRSLYEYDSVTVLRALRRMLGLKNVQAEDENEVAAALRLAEHGMDLADASHLCSRPAGARFVSFDKPLVNRATRAGAGAVARL